MGGSSLSRGQRVECNRSTLIIGTVAVCKHWNVYTNFALWLVDSLTPTRTDQPQSEVTVQMSNVYTRLPCLLVDCLEIVCVDNFVVSDVDVRVITCPGQSCLNCDMSDIVKCRCRDRK